MPAVTNANLHLVSTSVPHRIRTAMVRDDLVGWVVAGRKRLATPTGVHTFGAGQDFLISRATQWDMVNEPGPCGRYVAHIMAFTPPLVELFHDRFGQFAATAALQGCASSMADEVFTATMNHATAALQDGEVSQAVREHRALEVLLLLAERGLVFAPTSELAWADRVRRLVAQRPQATWALGDIARAFHLSSSTLQRRLALEGASVSQCVREVRLETAMTLLQGSTLQVSEIASRCGYDSHSRFSAAFRGRFGFPPSHLRP